MFQQLPILEFDDIASVKDRFVMDAIAKASNMDLALALVDASTEMKSKFFRNMPRRRVNIVREEMLVGMRTYTLRGGELAQKRILELVNKRIIDDL